MRPSTASPIYLYAYFQRILGVAPSTLAPRPHTATHAARDSNLDSDNHDMSRLSALAYLNDAPIHGLTDKPLAYFQRILGGTLTLAFRPDTHNTTTSAKLALSRPKNYLRAAPVEFGHSACIRLTAASSHPLFLTDLGAAPSPLAPRPDPHG